MSLREQQPAQLDTEGARHTGRMDWQSRSHRYLMLQVWCALLTVAMVVMAALFASIKPRLAENEALTLKPEVSPTANTTVASLKATGSPLSHIEMITTDGTSWVDSESCDSCFLARKNDAILCKKDSVYFLYAQVAFSRHSRKTNSKSVVLIKHPSHGPNRKLVEGIYASTTEASVWVSRAVKLKKGDRVKINITGDFLKDISHWGAFELH